VVWCVGCSDRSTVSTLEPTTGPESRGKLIQTFFFDWCHKTLYAERTLTLVFPLMGTRGYAVYRIKGRYYVNYNHYDAHPDGLGLRLLHEIPRNVSKEEFEEWVERTIRHPLQLGNSDGSSKSDFVPDKRPKTTTTISNGSTKSTWTISSSMSTTIPYFV
jgi:hypothetical protein